VGGSTAQLPPTSLVMADGSSFCLGFRISRERTVSISNSFRPSVLVSGLKQQPPDCRVKIDRIRYAVVTGWCLAQGCYILRENSQRELPSQGCENKITSFCSRSPGSAVLAASRRHILRGELCSRAVSENYYVFGQFEVAVDNLLSAGADCAKCLAFRVTCAAVGGPFADFPGVLRLSSRGI